jgi:hypothetical protein
MYSDGNNDTRGQGRPASAASRPVPRRTTPTAGGDFASFDRVAGSPHPAPPFRSQGWRACGLAFARLPAPAAVWPCGGRGSFPAQPKPGSGAERQNRVHAGWCRSPSGGRAGGGHGVVPRPIRPLLLRLFAGSRGGRSLAGLTATPQPAPAKTPLYRGRIQDRQARGCRPGGLAWPPPQPGAWLVVRAVYSAASAAIRQAPRKRARASLRSSHSSSMRRENAALWEMAHSMASRAARAWAGERLVAVDFGIVVPGSEFVPGITI